MDSFHNLAYILNKNWSVIHKNFIRVVSLDKEVPNKNFGRHPILLGGGLRPVSALVLIAVCSTSFLVFSVTLKQVTASNFMAFASAVQRGCRSYCIRTSPSDKSSYLLTYLLIVWNLQQSAVPSQHQVASKLPRLCFFSLLVLLRNIYTLKLRKSPSSSSAERNSVWWLRSSVIRIQPC